jgi:purine-nucleoside phosphorylase
MNDERLGVRFPDLLHTYEKAWLDKAMLLAKVHGIRAYMGVYAGLPGPNLETPAEYEFLHRIGADVVGMSTIPEVLVARHANMKVFVISVVSNKSYPLETIRETTVKEVIATVEAAEPKVSLIIKSLLK